MEVKRRKLMRGGEEEEREEVLYQWTAEGWMY